MNRQKSFENERPTLYLVATPIGNLDEMTYRSINTLKNVKYIAAEDTRNTVKLLNHFEISTKLISHHEHNIKQSIPKLIQLLEEGNEVICLDNYFTGSKENVIPLLKNPHFELIRHDVSIPFQAEVDEIYNLACPASPVYYQIDPIQTIKTSVLGAVNMLGLAKRVNAKILQASTSEVYGDPMIHPQPESYWGNVNPIGPRSCYDEGKRCAETLFMDYHRQNKVRIKIIRIFNTYGPNMSTNDGRVVSNFIIQALQNKDITIYGDGNQTRSFQYVDD